MRKKIFTFLLALVASVGTLFADGQCGLNLYWKYGGASHTLTIYGTGEMETYSDIYKAPWDDIRDKIESVIVEDGATSIGDMAFYQCKRLSYVYMNSTVIDIKTNALKNKPIKIVPGGVTRQESVYNALQIVNTDIVIGHRDQTKHQARFCGLVPDCFAGYGFHSFLLSL